MAVALFQAGSSFQPAIVTDNAPGLLASVVATPSGLSPKTHLFGGLRWQRYRTDIDALFDHDEAAVFAGFTYTFR